MNTFCQLEEKMHFLTFFRPYNQGSSPFHARIEKVHKIFKQVFFLLPIKFDNIPPWGGGGGRGDIIKLVGNKIKEGREVKGKVKGKGKKGKGKGREGLISSLGKGEGLIFFPRGRKGELKREGRHAFSLLLLHLKLSKSLSKIQKKRL